MSVNGHVLCEHFNDVDKFLMFTSLNKSDSSKLNSALFERERVDEGRKAVHIREHANWSYYRVYDCSQPSIPCSTLQTPFTSPIFCFAPVDPSVCTSCGLCPQCLTPSPSSVAGSGLYEDFPDPSKPVPCLCLPAGLWLSGRWNHGFNILILVISPEFIIESGSQ